MAPRLGNYSNSDVDQALEKAEAAADRACGGIEVGAGCRSQCRMGALAAMGAFNESLVVDRAKLRGQLGIIVAPREDCPKGFEEIIVKSPLNKKVKVCRLAKGFRKKDAPKGKPAHKGPLRRLLKFGPGVEADSILTRRDHKTRKAERRLTS